VCAGGAATASVQEDCAEERWKGLVGEGAGGARRNNGLKLFFHLSLTGRAMGQASTR
jgi:hypothetical protein